MDNAKTASRRGRAAPSPILGVIAFAVALVALLVLLHRWERLQLRPASGSAHALSQAGAPPAEAGAQAPR